MFSTLLKSVYDFMSFIGNIYAPFPPNIWRENLAGNCYMAMSRHYRECEYISVRPSKMDLLFLLGDIY